MRKTIWVVSILILTTALAAAQARYTVTDLGTLGGTTTACAHGLNSRTQIAGVSTLPGNEIVHVFFWQIVAAGFFNGETEFRSVLLTPNKQ